MSAGFDACNLNSIAMGFLGDSDSHSERVAASHDSSKSHSVSPREHSQPLDGAEITRTEHVRSGPVTNDMQVGNAGGETIESLPSGSTSVGPASVPRNLQRVAEARKQQGFSLRTISRRTGINIRTLRTHELPETDLKLSELHAWQLALEVPLVDLIEDESQPLSRPVRERAALVRVMKTAVALKEAGGPPRMQRLADMLCEQLIELMPELSEIGGWPQHGSRRTDHSCRMFEQQVNTSSLDIE